MFVNKVKHNLKMEQFKVFTGGDPKTGKTCLLATLKTGKFPDPDGYIPTVCDQFAITLSVKGRDVDVNAAEDSSHGEDYDRLRPLNYPGTDVFMVLFSVDSRESLENAKNRWIPEMRGLVPRAAVLLVANKIDLRDDEDCETISSAEGYCAAKQMGASYFEMSCKQLKGIVECFSHAVEIARLNTKKMKKKLKMKSVLLPPLKPPPAPEPVVKVISSTFADDWLQTLSHPEYHDVSFVVEGERSFYTHKIILCSASPFFSKLFDAERTDSLSRDAINAGKIQGIQKVEASEDGMETVVHLSDDIQAKIFVNLLELMYTGHLSKKLKDVDVSELKRVAQIFDMAEVVSQCDDRLTGDGKGPVTFSSDLKGTAMTNFLKREIFCDVFFHAQGNKVMAAHKVVVCTRNPMMAATLVGSTSISGEASHTEVPVLNASVKNLTLFLEYLYTDQVHLDDSSDAIGLIKLADKYEAHRLVSLCEMAVKKQVDSMRENLKAGDVLDAIKLLRKFKACKATQMVHWCRHYICHNYDKFSEMENFTKLDWDDEKFIKQHRWPPLHYEYEVEDFERKLSKCGVR